MPSLTARQAAIRSYEQAIEYYNTLSVARQATYMPDWMDDDDDDDASNSEEDFEEDFEMQRLDEEMLAMELDIDMELMDEEFRIEEMIMDLGNGDEDDDSSGDVLDSPRATAQRRLEEIESSRYLFRTQYRKDDPQARWYQRAMNEDGRDLRSMFRMDPPNLDRVVATLRRHSVYQSRGTKPQKDPALQIGVALYYFGGTCNKHRIARIFGISPGSVHNYVEKFVTAVLSLKEEYIEWPKPGSDEYHRVTGMHLIHYGLPHCLGYVDGTMIPFWRKPDGESGGFYWTRKNVYAFNLTCIVDSETRILFAVTGSEGPHNVNTDFCRRGHDARQRGSQSVSVLHTTCGNVLRRPKRLHPRRLCLSTYKPGD
jgi:hypothetical protein